MGIPLQRVRNPAGTITAHEWEVRNSLLIRNNYDGLSMQPVWYGIIVMRNVCWKSLIRYFMRVRIWDNYGEECPWQTTEFLTALQHKEEWKADFITAEAKEDREEAPGTAVRKEFSATKPIKEAFLVSTAYGLYQVYLNGKRVGCDELAPGWTSYHKRLLYQSYDVTGLIRQGENAIGACPISRWGRRRILWWMTEVISM